MQNFRVFLLLAAGVAAMSTSAILIRWSAAPPLVIAFYRLVLTAVLAAALGGGRPLRRVRRLSLAEKLLLAGAGVALSFHFALWITSLAYTSVASSVLFTNLQVIFVPILSLLLLREKISPVSVIGILIALGGSLGIVGGDQGQGRLMGDLMALASGFFIALALIAGRQMRSRIDIWTYTFLVSATAGAFLGLICLAGGPKLVGYPLREYALFFLMALIPGVCGHGVINWALKYVKAPVASVAILGESIGASILAWIIFGEGLAFYQLAGGFFILLGIYIAASHEGVAG